ncbi:rsbT co-antagonist protein RsbR [Bacillus sp. OV322]|uniref:STAS domain-containing protein n=1 Tax=Bacillus sp. OV322 TaxID=1882764 RepID=UPI0008E40D30|nr:STAS domain-containing protein [Bacillus sp. OV322]SFC35623.1 rsbT co-antagonist protein RsbR [Bacillus sp. OV322]
MSGIETFAIFLIRNADSISREIVEYNLGKLEIELPYEIVEKSITNNREFLEFLGSSLHLSDESVTEMFLQWHKKHLEKSRAESHQFSFEDISSLIKPYAETKLQLINMLAKTTIKQGLSTDEVVFVNNRTGYLLDLSITQSILERERLADEMNVKNQKVITELSSPIVPIQNGIAILPLIGEFDLIRSEHIMDKVIPKISNLKIECLIIDFSGLVTIDNEVAGRIFTINKVLKLLGVKTIFTGIRSDLATMSIAAGIDFTDLETFSTVKQAILSIS